MRKILILLTSISLFSLAAADTQDYIKCRVILVKSNIAYFDAGQKDGVAAGQDFEFLYDEQVVGTGKVAWADQNISRSEPLDSASASNIRLFEPLIAKIRLI